MVPVGGRVPGAAGEVFDGSEVCGEREDESASSSGYLTHVRRRRGWTGV